MASALYPLYKQQILGAGLNLSTLAVHIVLVDVADYTYNASHEFLTSVAAGARVAVAGPLLTPTIVGGTFDAADITFTAVTGDPSEALVIYQHTGTDGTSRLIAYIDTATGLPVTPNGGDILVSFDVAGIFSL